MACSPQRVPNAPGVFDIVASPDVPEVVVAAIDSSLRAARALLPGGAPRVTVQANTARSIAGYGVGGFTPSAAEVLVFVDRTAALDSATLVRRVAFIAAHEYHHAVRWACRGYGTTLRAAIVSEGLADDFALRLVGGEHPPWMQQLSSAEFEHWTAEVSRSTSDAAYDHDRWFFGTDPAVPRWIGYRIGAAVVSEYRRSQPSATERQWACSDASQVWRDAGTTHESLDR